ncbi:M10 family metallopeptidase C-terminal domain-containing protein [Rugamonas sp. CCM 8940]|uniref:M10 family metallopeptidase C-terminal domain-containing protein n=1 Tax=Rugamonas sp. CCM 8940 TaxID=2765359 RepID=UPI001F291F21
MRRFLCARPPRPSGTGDDVLNGAAGDDILEGGSGNDVLIGQAGADIFRFNLPTDGADSIADFVSKVDTIQVVGSGFGLSAGSVVVLQTGATTPAASGAAAQFLYNASSGALYFDRDGAEAAYDPVLIATLTGQKALVAGDIVVIGG